MKTLIVYASKDGSAEPVAAKMKEDLGENVVVLNLQKESDAAVNQFQRIIIGGTLQKGQVQKCVKTFCCKNLDELLTKEVGLFICSREEEMPTNRLLMSIYPEELYNTAKSTAVFKSGFEYNRMSFLDKLRVRKSRRLKHNSSKLDFEAVQKFSRRMDRVFNPFLFLA